MAALAAGWLIDVTTAAAYNRGGSQQAPATRPCEAAPAALPESLTSAHVFGPGAQRWTGDAASRA